jgi:hypothetical protein
MALSLVFRPPRLMRLLLASFPPLAVVLQLSILVGLLNLRLLLPPDPLRPAPLGPAFGGAMDVVFALAAVMTADPGECAHFARPERGSGGGQEAKDEEEVRAAEPKARAAAIGAPPPSVPPRRFRRRLARVAAFLRWLVFVPSASRAVAFWLRAARGPADRTALLHAVAAFLTSLRMLQPD